MTEASNSATRYGEPGQDVAAIEHRDFQIAVKGGEGVSVAGIEREP